jgi:hypothetical protein
LLNPVESCLFERAEWLFVVDEVLVVTTIVSFSSSLPTPNTTIIFVSARKTSEEELYLGNRETKKHQQKLLHS